MIIAVIFPSSAWYRHVDSFANALLLLNLQNATFLLRPHPDNTILAIFKKKILPPHFKMSSLSLENLVLVSDVCLYTGSTTGVLPFHQAGKPTICYADPTILDMGNCLDALGIPVPRYTKDQLREAILCKMPTGKK